MAIDYVMAISRLKRPCNLTLIVDPMYARVWKAMGIWRIDDTNAIASGYSGQNTQGARWFWDDYNDEISLKMGWLEGGTNETAITAFKLFTYKATSKKEDMLNVGDSGRGYYYDAEKREISIDWRLARIGYGSRVEYPELKK